MHGLHAVATRCVSLGRSTRCIVWRRKAPTNELPERCGLRAVDLRAVGGVFVVRYEPEIATVNHYARPQLGAHGLGALPKLGQEAGSGRRVAQRTR